MFRLLEDNQKYINDYNLFGEVVDYQYLLQYVINLRGRLIQLIGFPNYYITGLIY